MADGMRWLPVLFLLAACSTGYKPIVDNIEMGSSNAEFYLSSSQGKDTVHLYMNMNFRPQKPVDLQIEIINAGNDTMSYQLLKIVGPTRAASIDGEHWIYYFYATPARHFARKVRVTISTRNIRKRFLLEGYRHVHLLS
jgi:hypothetical protein